MEKRSIKRVTIPETMKQAFIPSFTECLLMVTSSAGIHEEDMTPTVKTLVGSQTGNSVSASCYLTLTLTLATKSRFLAFLISLRLHLGIVT